MAGTYTPTTEDAAGTGQAFYQDVEISPATLADGSLRQRFDTKLYPELGVTGDAAPGSIAVGLVCAPNPPIANTDFTLTATITAKGVDRAVTGTVQFKDGATNLGTPVAVASGGAATTVTGGVAAGAHSFTAVYSGDSTHAGASSSAVAVTVA